MNKLSIAAFALCTIPIPAAAETLIHGFGGRSGIIANTNGPTWSVGGAVTAGPVFVGYERTLVPGHTILELVLSPGAENPDLDPISVRLDEYDSSHWAVFVGPSLGKNWRVAPYLSYSKVTYESDVELGDYTLPADTSDLSFGYGVALSTPSKGRASPFIKMDYMGGGIGLKLQGGVSIRVGN